MGRTQTVDAPRIRMGGGGLRVWYYRHAWQPQPSAGVEPCSPKAHVSAGLRVWKSGVPKQPSSIAGAAPCREWREPLADPTAETVPAFGPPSVDDRLCKA